MLTIVCAESKVTWTEEVHNFGAFNEDDGNVDCTFTMINTGDYPVAIASARATCGCTTPRYTREPVMPGDTAFISVSFNPIGRPGRFEKKIYVDLTDKEEQRQTLTITGTVIGSPTTMKGRFPVEADQVRLSNPSVAFGEITRGKSKNAFLRVYNPTDQEITPRWANVPKWLRITTNSPTIQPGEQTTYVLSATANDNYLYGFIDEVVSFIPTPSSTPYELDVMAMFLEDFSALSPQQLENAPRINLSNDNIDFGAYDSKAGRLTSAFSIGNSGIDPLKIRRVYSADKGVEATINKTTVKKGKKAEIKVEIDPSLLSGEMINSRLVIISNDPENPISIVRLVGYPKK